MGILLLSSGLIHTDLTCADLSTRFKLVAISCTAGLELARLADFPEDVLVEAHRVSAKLTELEARKKEDSKFNKVAVRRKAMLRVTTIFFLSSFLYHHGSRN